MCARRIDPPLHQLPFTHGNGWVSHGADFIWTLQVHTWDTFLVIVDACSKWLDAYIMSTITSSKTIETLKTVFATYGLPQTIVTDNDSSFTSEEFKRFMDNNGIKHITSAPYHPSSNGQAERPVQTLKQGIKRTPGANVQKKKCPDFYLTTESSHMLLQVLLHVNC